MDINNKDNDLFKIDELFELNEGKNVSDKKGGKVVKKVKVYKEKKS